MNADDYTAGVAQFQATGSLIARPPRIVPGPLVVIPPLWPTPYDIVLPDGPIDVRRTDGRGTPVFPDAPWEIPAPEWAVTDMIAQRWHETVRQFEQTWLTPSPDVGPVPPGTVVEVPEIPWRYDVGHITVSSPPPGRNIFRERWLAAIQEFFGATDPPNYVLDEDLVATLLDFARAGDAAAFRELALMRGVPAGEIGQMWDGTVKRIGKQ